MMFSHRSVAGSALLVLCAAQLCLAGDLVKAQYKQEGAWASFAQQNGCVTTSVFVEVGRLAVQKSVIDQSDSVKALAVLVQNNLCTQTILLAAVGTKVLEPFEYELSNLKFASVNTELVLISSSTGLPITIQIQVEWLGLGEPTRENISYHFWTPGLRYSSRQNGVGCPAQSHGIVSDLTQTYLDQNAYIAELFTLKSGSLEIRSN